MRVSEALRRASEEKEQPIEKAKPEPEHQLEDIIDESFRAGTNGRASPITLSELHSEPKRRLRERIEDLLVGKDLSNGTAHSLVALDQSSPAGEQYKILREQIKKSCAKGGVHILAVMSPIKGDGKTTVAANLAAALALDYEQQVLLLDADLRSPSIHQFFGIKSTPGLADYLSSDSKSGLMSYVQTTPLTGLRIFPAGQPSSRSSELLAKEKMKALVREIPSRFPDHLVIVDTPPVLSTSDSLVLAQQVDGIVMVTRAGKTPRAYLTEALKLLASNKVMGVILNGAELVPASRYYYSAPSQSRLSKLD